MTAVVVTGGRAYCRRDGCGERIGDVVGDEPGERLRLADPGRGLGWVRVTRPGDDGSPGPDQRPLTRIGERRTWTFVVKRRRRQYRSEALRTASGHAWPMDIVECPQCRTRQFVRVDEVVELPD